MTVVKTTGSRFLCYEPLIEMIRVQSLWHIIIRNRCMRQGLNHYPLCQRIPNKLVLRKDTDIIHVAMGGVKKFLHLLRGGSNSFGGLRRGIKKVWRQKFSTAQPPHQSIYEHSLSSGNGGKFFYGPRWICRPRLKLFSDNNFPPFPSRAVNICLLSSHYLSADRL